MHIDRGNALPGLVTPADGPACVRYVPGWLDDDDRWMAALVDTVEWEQPTVTVFGRQHPTPRLTAWYGDAAYSYSGITHAPSAFPAPLSEIRTRLLTTTGVRFNSCLANLYRDGTDSMGAHADNEPELGPEPTIASVSLGARRRFVMTHVESGERFTWTLGMGDLLVMSGESQRDFRHAVPKTTARTGPRLNLTFRVFAT
jgi:alkylated DNA repair dioxygenase AlkB